jgi:inner membrane protein
MRVIVDIHMSSTTKKALAVLALVLLCFIPTLFVMGVISDRQQRSSEVREKVGREYGQPQEFLGPVLTVPYTRTDVVDGKQTVTERQLSIFPDVEELSVGLLPSIKTRGIFHVRVYDAKISGIAKFSIPSQNVLSSYGKFDWTKAVVGFPLTDVRSIIPESTATIDGTPAPLLQGAGITGVQGVHIEAPLVAKRSIDVRFDLGVSGNESFSFLPAGSVTVADASSSWNSPSFTGAYLPTDSQVGDTGFQASWRVSGLGRAFPQIVPAETFGAQASIDPFVKDLSVAGSGIRGSLISIKLFDGVDQYTLVTRAVKYAILFIALTFMGFFFVEVLNRMRVHPIQYALVGAALALFYLLLLSLSEQIGFLTAYLISAGLTTLLIASYTYFILHGKRFAFIIGGLLLSLYAYLYLVLRSEDFALLSGTFLLFGILAVTMYITRKIDWYNVDR